MATVVYRCSIIINRLSENKSGLQTKTEGNTSTIKGQSQMNPVRQTFTPDIHSAYMY